MFGVQLHISSARRSSWKSASAVDLQLFGRICGAHMIEGRSGVGVVTVRATSEGGATAVVGPLHNIVNSAVASPRPGQVGGFSEWVWCRRGGD